MLAITVADRILRKEMKIKANSYHRGGWGVMTVGIAGRT
jgi:hypothetical protein